MTGSWNDDDEPINAAAITTYNKIDPAMVQAELEREYNAKKEGSGRFLKALPEGETILRFLPPTGDMRLPWRTAVLHDINRPDGSFTSIVCPRAASHNTRGCPVCQQVQRLYARQTEVDERAAKRLEAKDKAFANVMVRGAEHEGAKVWKFNSRPFRKGAKFKSIGAELMLLLVPDEDTSIGGDFSDPLTGFDIKVHRAGTGATDTSWSIKPGKRRPLHTDPVEAERILGTMHDLSRFTRAPSDEELLASVKGEDRGGSKMQRHMEG